MPKNTLHIYCVLAVVLLVILAACGGTEKQNGDLADSATKGMQKTSATQSANDDATTLPSVAATEESNPRLGTALVNPERYYGLYANPDAPNRQWFVTEAKRSPDAEQSPEVPPGYLAVGARFGDVAPWHMKTLSETIFEQAWVSDYQPEPATVEFQLDSDGNAVAMTFIDENNPSGRLVRVGDLPADWQ